MRILWWLNVNKIWKRFYNHFSRIFNCKHGGGFVERLNSFPFEAHLPGYNFCGPGTKLQNRVDNGDQGINLKMKLAKITTSHILKPRHWVNDVWQTPYWLTKSGHVSRHQIAVSVKKQQHTLLQKQWKPRNGNGIE